MMHPHEIEEMEMQSGPRMWDAGEGVCCAYFQTGACAHTEAAYLYEEDDDPHPVRTTGDDEVVYAVESEEPF